MALGREGACSDKEEEVRVAREGSRGQPLHHTHTSRIITVGEGEGRMRGSGWRDSRGGLLRIGYRVGSKAE